MVDFIFVPVQRFVAPAPIPYVISEKELPTDQKILVFLPHSDDGRYFGSSLYLMNKHNDVKIIIISPGTRGVDDNVSIKSKIDIRYEESQCWAKMLGFQATDIINFRADKTYNLQYIDPIDQVRMNCLIEKECPSMIFIPYIGDTAQHINFQSREMVIQSLLNWLMILYNKNKKNKDSIFVIEYPTNHVPIIPPSDKNFIITFSNPSIADIKHEANKAHVSQQKSGFDITEKFVEAIETVSEADTLYQMQKRRRFARYLSDVEVDATSSRGEHFGITKIKVYNNINDTTIITEERLKFPLSKKDKKNWNKSC